MDQARRTVELAASHEQQKNRILNEGLQRQIWLRNVTAGLAMLLGLPMILLLFLSRNREISRRMKTELELKELTGVLESRVATSTAGFERSAGLLNLVLRNIHDTVFLINTKDNHRNVIRS